MSRYTGLFAGALDAKKPDLEKLNRMINYYQTHGILPSWAPDYGFSKQDIDKVYAARKELQK